MKHKHLVTIHVVATVIAFSTITIFFTSSLIVEIRGNLEEIQLVKKSILLALPLLLLAMPALAISGNKLGGKSSNPVIVGKKKRMKIMVINGVMLIALAILLYYRSHAVGIDAVFGFLQLVEFSLGLINLTILGLNAKAGLVLSGTGKNQSIRKATTL